MSNRWASILLLFVTLGVVAVSQAGCSPATAQVETPGEEQRTISVSGSGTVSAAPDEVVLRLGVETMAETASEALSENSEQMEAVIAALTEAGVPAENVQTQTVQLRPQYETPPRETGPAQEPELIGYVASNIVEARSSDLDAVGQLLDQAVQAGANRIEGLRFEVSEPGELLEQAREAAWQDAEEKAQQLATLAGAELGNVLSINESTTAPRPVGLGGAVERAAAVPIEPGAQDIQVDLQVSWSVR
jgi:uncharacterized protein YggE